MNRDELLDLIPAYAIGALDDDELTEVEAFIAQDTEAQSLLRDYEAVASVFPFAAPERPAPSHLKADLKARLAKNKPQTVENKVQAESDTSVQKEPTKSNILPFPSSIISAAAAILVVAIGLVFFLMQPEETTQNPNEILFNQLLAQEDSLQFNITPDVAEEATGVLVASADGSQAILRISSLPDTTEEESYQLWVISEAGVQSGGIFHWPTGHGPYFIPIEQSVEELVAIGMTIEPYDGSPLGNEPTGERLFAVAVASAE